MYRAASEKHIVDRRKKEAKYYLGKYYTEKNFRKCKVGVYRCRCNWCRNLDKRQNELHKIEDKECLAKTV